MPWWDTILVAFSASTRTAADSKTWSRSAAPTARYLGSYPTCTLTLIGSNLFGTTEEGGTSGGDDGFGNGTIFSINTNGSGFQSLFTFNGTNGSSPGVSSSLTLIGSTFYGITGDVWHNGTIFSFPVSGGTATTLCSFSSSGQRTVYPVGSLTFSGSTFYGMTEYGGPINDGMVFSVPVSGGTATPSFRSVEQTASIPLAA